MKRTALLSLFLIFISVSYSHAQWGIGLHFPSVSWLNNQGYYGNNESVGFYSPRSGGGIGIQGYYVIKPKMRVNLSFDYIGTLTETTEADTFIQGQYLQSFVHVTTPALITHADFNYAIVHDFIHRGFNFYALGGFSLNTYGYKTDFKINSTGPNGTSTGGTPEQTHTYTGASLNLGLGIECAFSSRFRLYFDLRGCTGDKTMYSTPNLYNVDLLPNYFNPAYISSALGVRYNLFSPQDQPQTQPEPQQQPGHRPYRRQN